MISIVIPAFNEENRIGGSLQKIANYFSLFQQEYEVIVVDDGSTDSTTEAVAEFEHILPELQVIRCTVNRGKGFSLRQGVLASRGDLVLVTDADLSTPIEEIQKLSPLISNSDCEIAIGSRALALSEILKKQPFWRRGMGKTFNKIVKFLIMGDFNDTQCGFKLFSGDLARSLFRDAIIDRFAYDVEILALAKGRGYRIIEVPIRWVNSPESKVNPLRDSLQMLKDLIRIRLHLVSLKKKASKNLIGKNHPVELTKKAI